MKYMAVGLQVGKFPAEFFQKFLENNRTYGPIRKFCGNFPTICDIKCHETQQQMSTISPNRLRKIKGQLNNGKSHYGQWT